MPSCIVNDFLPIDLSSRLAAIRQISPPPNLQWAKTLARLDRVAAEELGGGQEAFAGGLKAKDLQRALAGGDDQLIVDGFEYGAGGCGCC